MPRVAPPEREQLPASELADYDRVIERQSKLWAGAHTSSDEYFLKLLNSPPLASALVGLGRAVREGSRRGAYTDAERELVDVVFSVDMGYNAILYLHLPDIFACGVRLEAVEALLGGHEERLDEGERQIVAFARAVKAGEVDDAQYAALRERLGERGALEFSVLCGFLLCTFRLWMALGVPEVEPAKVDELLRAQRDGTAAYVDPEARLG